MSFVTPGGGAAEVPRLNTAGLGGLGGIDRVAYLATEKVNGLRGLD